MTTTTTLRDTSRQDSLLDLSSLMNLSIIIYGQGQMVWEVVRNLSLIGVKSITIIPPISYSPYQFNSHAFNTIQNLNPECKIILYSQPLSLQDLTQNLIPQHKLCILVNILNQKEIISINEACRNHSPEHIGFLYGCNLGFYGNTFVDFGSKFIVKDPYKSQRTFPILDLTINEDPQIEILTEDSHNFLFPQKSIKLKGLPNTTFKIINVGKKEDLIVITLLPEEKLPSNLIIDKKSFTNFELMLESKIMKFESFECSLSNFGLLKKMRGPQKISSKALHHLFLAILAFYEIFQKLPDPSDHPKFLALYQQVSSKNDLNKEILVQFLENLSYEFPPIAFAFGALLANEALKISGTYIPLQQWFHFEEFFCSGNPKLQSHDPLHKISQLFISSNIFSSIISNNTLKNFKIFIVGAGALGCEDLRLLAAMNACTGAQGKIYFADDDTISKSNLHRQALYGPNDVGKSKCMTASQKILEYNPQWEGKIEAFHCQVNHNNHKIFPDEFWESLDVIIAAVDGVPARNYLQGQAKKYKKVFINAGTDGVNFQTGVYLPEKSDIFLAKESQRDSVQNCTLKSHPYKIEHVIQYGCGRFEQVFVEEIQSMQNQIEKIKNFDFDEQEADDFDSTNLKNLIEMVNTTNYPLTKAYAIIKAEIYDNIRKTITWFPIDSKDSNGNLKWGAPNRFPTPIELTPDNPTHVNLLRSTANILAMNYGRQEIYTEQDIITFLKNPQDMFIFEKKNNEDFVPHIKKLQAQINKGELSADPITYSEFDKDDDSRFHMDFLEAFTTACAANYNIGTITRNEIRIIAGHIIPNMIITTSFAVSLSMLEVYKYSLGLESEVYRGYWGNLAYGNFDATIMNENSPMDFNGKVAFRPWDVIEIQGPKKIGEIVKKLEEEYGIRVRCINPDFTNFLDYYKKGQVEELVDENLEEQESVKEIIANGGKYMWLKIEVEKKRKEEVNGDFPVVKYVMDKEKTSSLWKNLEMNQDSIARNS